MKDFYRILDECFTKLSSGTATVDECLARYPEYAEQLKPLLQTVLVQNRERDMMPPLPAFSAAAHSAVIQNMRPNPRQPQSIALSWRTMLVLAMLIAGLLVTGTVHAQSALPGDVYYPWKRTSELAWQALAPNQVTVDIILAERRLNEWIAVSKDPALNASAMRSYQEALFRLESVDDVVSIARITPELQSQQQTLSNAGLSLTQLDDYLTTRMIFIPTATPLATVPPITTEVPSTNIPQIATEVPLAGISTEVAPTTCVPNCGNNKGGKGNGKNNGKGRNGDGHPVNGKGNNK